MQFPAVSSISVKEKWNIWLPILLMIVFACTRWPGLLPPNFSAFYALAFCAGVYFPRRLAWWLPFTTMLLTDIVLNLCYYHTTAITGYLMVNYLAYAALIWLGSRHSPRSSWLRLVCGGLIGAIIFYLVTNTASWINDPAYAKTIAGWIQALTVGRPDWHPTTLEFFRNTLLSGGVFTALFVGSMKLTAESPQDKEAGARSEAEPATEEAPEEAKA